MPLQRTRRLPTASPGRETRAALHIIGMICAMRCPLISPKILKARVATGKEKSLIWVAEQGRGGLLFLIAGRVGNFASMIQVTHIFIGFHRVVSHRKTSYSNREKWRKGKQGRIHDLHGLAAVLNRAARLRIRIPNRSMPRPHADPTRRRSVGIAL